PQIVRVPPDTSAVLSAVAALEAEGSRGSLEAAAAALRPLFEQAERTGDLPAAAALRARLDAIAVRLDEAQLKDALQP
ncbi:MAG TPA: hypothetical protein DEB06_03655, partial [Phycisphaerales bacterium]|nr:hypothetical protein [Phycisphaerales bacterium]